MQWWILIERSGQAELYNATLCTLLLDLTSISGLTTGSVAANIWWFDSCHHGTAGVNCCQAISWKLRVCRNFTWNFIQNLSTVLLCRMHLHSLFGPFTHSLTRTFLVSTYSDQNGYFQWAMLNDNWMLSFLTSCEDRNSFSFSNHVFEKLQDNGQCSNYSYVCNTLPSKTFRMMKYFFYHDQKVSFKLQRCLSKFENGDVKVQCDNAIRRNVTAKTCLDNTHFLLCYLKFITSALFH